MTRLRDRVLDEVEALLRRGQTVLLVGPWGIGKSAWLARLHERAEATRVPCGLSARTDSLADVTRALSRAYPHVPTSNRSQRGIRSALRMALERRSGLLLLDHFRAAGTATRGFLRSLRGSGLGIAIAVDVERPRDLERVKALRLAYYERAVPPLRGEPLRRLLASAVGDARRHELTAIVRMAAGRPGWLVRIGERLRDPEYWRGDRILLEKLHADLRLDVLAHYVGDGAGVTGSSAPPLRPARPGASDRRLDGVAAERPAEGSDPAGE